MTIATHRFDLSLFSTQHDGVAKRAFDAAVVWRHRRSARRPQSVWRIFTALLESNAARPSAPRSANPFKGLDGWSSTGHGTPGRWVGFHRERGVVRVDDRDYPVRIDDQTVVLLAATLDDGRITVTSYALPIAAFPAYRRSSLRSTLLATAWAAVRRRARPVDPIEQWLQGITGDQVVAAFLAARAEHGAT